MLRNTFLHLPGIGATTERRIWGRGLHDWDGYLAAHRDGAGRAIDAVRESIERFDQGDWNFFDRGLPSPHKWRAFGDLGPGALYVDIETTGMGDGAGITVIGTFDGFQYKAFVEGHNLDAAVEEIERHPLVITFNGAQFDLPMIRSRFRANFFNHVHVDLRFPLKALGYSGGLKKIESVLGISRSAETTGLDGWDAVRLWYDYRRGHENALELLLKYNEEDVRNLMPLMELVFANMIGALPAEIREKAAQSPRNSLKMAQNRLKNEKMA